MRILRIYLNLPPCKGGMENHILELSKQQENNGHSIILFFNQGNKLNPHDKQFFSRLKLAKRKPLSLFIILFYLRILVFLAFKRIRVDVIHIHGDWSSLIFSKTIKKLTGAKKIVFSIHGDISQYNSLKICLLNNQIKKASLIFTSGYDSYSRLKHEKPVYFQPSGINSVFTKLPGIKKHDSFSIISVANFDPVKNLSLFVKIASLLPQYAFILIGDGKEKKKIFSEIKSLDLKNIKLLGYLQAQEIAKELNKSHVFLLTSVKEGTPTAVLEAMACALPIITSSAGGLDHFLQDGENGFILDEFHDPSPYAEKIRHLDQDSRLRDKMATKNTKLARGFYWPAVSDRITKLIDE